MKTQTKKYRSAHELFSAPKEELHDYLKKVAKGAIEQQRETIRRADAIIASREQSKKTNKQPHDMGIA